MLKGVSFLIFCWLVIGWFSFFLFLGLGFLFRLVYVGRLKGEVYLGGFRIREGYGGKGIFSLVSLG